MAADYYPLISRAIEGLEVLGPRSASRRALYEQARQALTAQFRSAEPPLTETEITDERLAFEDAVRRVEREAAQRAHLHPQANDEPASDPLAELARLIGQSDPFGGRSGGAMTRDNDEGGDISRDLGSPPAWLKRARMADVVTAPSDILADIGPDPILQTHDRLPTPPIEVIPEQDLTAAIAFRPSRRGPLELLPDPPKDPHDPEQSQLYLRIRRQLEKLQADIPSQERAQIDEAVNDFLAQPASWPQVEFKKVLWLCGNALRNIIAQHDAVKDNPEPHYSKLPPSVAEAMRRPVEAWNVFVLGDADIVDLDAKRLGPQEQQSVINDINIARPIVESAAADRNITTEQTAKVLDAGLNAASTLADNINTRQAQQVVAGTLKNLITQLVRRAYLTCLAIAEPKSDEDLAFVAEYQKGIARGVGKVAVGATVAATAIGAHTRFCSSNLSFSTPQ